MGNCSDVVFYLQVCTVDHMKGGTVRLDATVMFSDECEINLDDPTPEDDQDLRGCSVMTFAHEHEDYDHDLWFSAYVPKSEDGCRVNEPCATGTLGVLEGDFSSRDPVQWWYMKDGAVLGGHNGMIIEYDPSTLAPLGMVSLFLYSYESAICLTSCFVNRWFPAMSWRTAAWRSSTTNGAATACACSTTRRAT